MTKSWFLDYYSLWLENLVQGIQAPSYMCSYNRITLGGPGILEILEMILLVSSLGHGLKM